MLLPIRKERTIRGCQARSAFYYQFRASHGATTRPTPVVLVWLAPPQTAQTITFYGLRFFYPPNPPSKGGLLGKNVREPSFLMLVAYLLGRFQMAKMIEELQLQEKDYEAAKPTRQDN